MAHVRYAPYRLFGFNLRNEREELCLVIFLKSLAEALTGIFIPIYFYQQLGLPIWTIALFFALHYFVAMISSFPVAKFIKAVGFRIPILIGAALHTLYFWLLWQLGDHPGLIWTVPVLSGTMLCLFWLPFNSDFLMHNKPKSGAKGFARYNIMDELSTALAPLIGGFIIQFYGYEPMFYTALGISAVMALTTLLLGEKAPPPKPTSAKNTVKNYIKKVKNKDIDVLLTLGEFPSIVSRLLWPIFLVGFLTDTVSIGALALVPTVIFIFLNVRISRAIDDQPQNTHIYMRNGLVGNSGFWIIKLATSNFLTSFLFGTFSDIFSLLYNLPLNAYVFGSTTERSHPVQFMLRREFGLQIGRIITLVLIALVAWILPDNMTVLVMFLASGAISLALSVIIKQVRLKSTSGEI